jgi:hypothetical protein
MKGIDKMTNQELLSYLKALEIIVQLSADKNEILNAVKELQKPLEK